MEAILLIGHGRSPRGMPREWTKRLRELDAESDEARALDARIRAFPRDEDPYGDGLRALAERIRGAGHEVTIAFFELASPSVEEAVDALAAAGVTRIRAFTTMITRGGSHAEHDIPALLERARDKHPTVAIDYVWPLDLDRVAELFIAHIS
jgi:sirohydrochlorin cobaltochelatase